MYLNGPLRDGYTKYILRSEMAANESGAREPWAKEETGREISVDRNSIRLPRVKCRLFLEETLGIIGTKLIHRLRILPLL